MKSPFIFSLFLLLTPYMLIAQLNQSGGGMEPHRTNCLDTQQRAFIQNQNEQNIARLKDAGRLTTDSRAAVSFILPLRASSNFDQSKFYGIWNFVDHNPATGALRDYNCGTRSYDTQSGYDHKGIDYFPFPFAWDIMDNDQVEIIAAAAGTIINKIDGQDDKSCSFNGRQWNAVYIRHADGSVAWYGHLKKNSLTDKQIGDFVNAGEYLGVIGSSGNSTGPHLHLEIYDAQNQLIDPYAGSCNPTTNHSWWIDQEPYYNSMVIALKTHPSAPNPYGCYGDNPLVEKESYDPGERVYFAAYYRDQRSGQQSTYRIIRPDGAVWQTWNASSNASHYPSSYWWWFYSLPNDAEEGIWKYEVDFQGETTTHEFIVGDVTIPRCEDPLEPNGAIHTATSIDPNGQIFEGLCLSKDDEDWFQFHWNGLTYVLRVSSVNGSEGPYTLIGEKIGTSLHFETFSYEGSSVDTKLELGRLNDRGYSFFASDDNSGNANFSWLNYNFIPDLEIDEESLHFSLNDNLLEISGNVFNSRQVNADAFEIGYYLSPSSSFEISQAMLIASNSYENLGVGSMNTADIAIEIDLSSLDLDVGAYYTFVYVDHLGQVNEFQENNNIGQWDVPYVVAPPAQADLTLDILDDQPTSFLIGDLAGVKTTVINIGEAASGAVQLGYYLSDDEQLSEDDLFLESFTVYELDPGNAIQMEDYFIIPNDQLAGTYYLFGILDETGQLSEENEGNNTDHLMIELLIPPPCVPPQGLAADVKSAHEVMLEWNAVEGAISYTLEYRIAGGDGWVRIDQIYDNQVMLDELTGNTTYEWRLQTICDRDESAFSILRSFLTPPGIPTDQVALKAGWNLISLDVLPADNSIASVMQLLQTGNLQYVSGFEEGAVFYDPNGPEFLNTLSHLEAGAAYWVKVLQPDTIRLVGSTLVDFEPLLKDGWNLVGYMPQEAADPLAYFQSISGPGTIRYIVGFDEGNLIYDPQGPDFLNSLVGLYNGFGYWVKVELNTNKNRLSPYATSINYMFVNGKVEGIDVGEELELRNESGTVLTTLRVGEGGWIQTQAIYGASSIDALSQALPKEGEQLSIHYNGYTFSDKLTFHADKGLRKLALNYTSLAGIEVYPNPFVDAIYVNLQMAEMTELELQLLDPAGTVVAKKALGMVSGELRDLSLQLSDLAAGFYILQVIGKGKVIHQQKLTKIQ